MLIRCLHFLRYAILVVGALHLLPNILVSLCLVDRESNGYWDQVGQSLALLLGAIAYLGAWCILQRHKTNASNLTRFRLEKEVWQKILHRNYALQFSRLLLLVTACMLLLAFTYYNVWLGFSKSSFIAAHVANRCGQFELSERIYKNCCEKQFDNCFTGRSRNTDASILRDGSNVTLAIEKVYGGQSYEYADWLWCIGAKYLQNGQPGNFHLMQAKKIYLKRGDVNKAIEVLASAAANNLPDNPDTARLLLAEAAKLYHSANPFLNFWTIQDLRSAATQLHDREILKLLDSAQTTKAAAQERETSVPEPVSRLLMFVWIFGLTGMGSATTKASIVLWRCFSLKLRLLSLLKDATTIANGPQGSILDSAKDANNWAIIENLREQIDLALYRNKQSSADELSRWLLSWVERGATETAAPRQFKLQSHEELKQQIDRASILLCTEFACFILLMLLASTLWMHREF